MLAFSSLGIMSAKSEKISPNYNIRFDSQPTNIKTSKSWASQTLPIGNGSIGANIFGVVDKEYFSFNEKSLWLGGPNTAAGAKNYWNINKSSAYLLPEIRKALEDGDYKKAEKLTSNNFNSTAAYGAWAECPFLFGNYSVMGFFEIATGCDSKQATDYHRILSLDSALVTVKFKENDNQYIRQSFISYPDNVMVLRFRSDKQKAQNLTLKYLPISVATGRFMRNKDNELFYNGYLNNNHMRFAVRVRAESDGGIVKFEKDKLVAKNCNSVTFYITADTDYKINFDPDFTDSKAYVGENPFTTTKKWIEEATKKGYDKIFDSHLKDYQNLFSRVKLTLNPKEKVQNIDTPTRLAHYKKGEKDSNLEALYFEYGRYLLIESSRKGNLPANLQGIWSSNVDSPWHADYHNNINLQMNYWPVNSTNLDECFHPLVDFIRSLVKPGKAAAKAYFNARGWTTGVSSNIFGFASPMSSTMMRWNFSPMAGPWLTTHLWSYYDYTRDEKFLKDTYSIIRDAALFTEDYLWKQPDGTYTAAPSTSPEHGPVDKGATFVHAVAREILNDAINASKILNRDEQLRKKWINIVNNIAPYQIGRYGQLMEWSRDIDDPKDNHRHVNHLFGLYPGHTISKDKTPNLAKAAQVVLEHRGDSSAGWSMCWKMNLWSHLNNGNHAYKIFNNLLKSQTNTNLFDTHPPFQIDGNFGGCAGVGEMLLQSHGNTMELLPALPDIWSEGSISGMKATGNVTVDLTWNKGALTKIHLLSKIGGTYTIKYAGKNYQISLKKGEQNHYRYKRNHFIKE